MDKRPVYSLIVLALVVGVFSFGSTASGNPGSSSNSNSDSNSSSGESSTSFTIYNNTCTDLSLSIGFNDGSGCVTAEVASYIYGADNYDTYAHPSAFNNIVTIQASELNTSTSGQSASWFKSGCGTEVTGYIHGGCQSLGNIQIVQISQNIFEINELMAE